MKLGWITDLSNREVDKGHGFITTKLGGSTNKLCVSMTRNFQHDMVQSYRCFVGCKVVFSQVTVQVESQALYGSKSSV